MGYDPQIKAALDDLLLDIPGVVGGMAFGYPAYKVKGRVFAFVGGPGIAIKLPAARVMALVERGAPFRPFEPVAGTVWKSWVSIDHADPGAYAAHLDLLEAAVAFTSDSSGA